MGQLNIRETLVIMSQCGMSVGLALERVPLVDD